MIRASHNFALFILNLGQPTVLIYWLWLMILLLWGGHSLAAEIVDDFYYVSAGSWGQPQDDQWGLKRIGFSPPSNGDSAWHVVRGTQTVIVAVIDTGLDYFHPDLEKKNVWHNPNEKPNGIDDDDNGYIDDLIGWNFVQENNDPWDYAGHGTHVSGIIAATRGNSEGIAGISATAQIMPLKVLNFVGRGRSVGIAEAIFYAVDKGARVINLSLGGEHVSDIERLAIEYAWKENVLVVVAAGNSGVDTVDQGPASLSSAITVGATDYADKRAAFSNWGSAVDIVAPGTEILSLRARRTDLNLIARLENYEPQSAFVGPQSRYYRASGTSFAAPFVSGVAALILAEDSHQSVGNVRQMILHSARDIDSPGVDQNTGYGLLDARAALTAKPGFYVDAEISGVDVVQRDNELYVQVLGTASANKFRKARLELGEGAEPRKWEIVAKDISQIASGGILALLPARMFSGAQKWTLRLVTEHKNGRLREARFLLELD